MSTLHSSNSAPIGRRTFAKAGLALAGLAGSTLLSGCSLLGIEDPNAVKTEIEQAPGVVDFENLEVRFSVEPSSWQWSVLDDIASEWNGYLVVAIPVSATNGDDTSRVLSSMYCKVFGPDGAQQEDLAQRFSDDILNAGNMGSGKTASGQLHILFRGPGIYSVKFDNLLGKKVTLDLEIVHNEHIPVQPFPTELNGYNEHYAVPQGESFDVGGLTIALTTDASSYTWSFISAPGDAYWDGRGAAGIPIRVTNNTANPVSFSTIAYQAYSVDTYQLPDASRHYPDSAINSLGTLLPNQTAASMLYVVYERSQVTCFCVFSNQGLPVVARIWIP